MSLLVFDCFDAGNEEVDAGGTFVPPVGVEVFDADGFAYFVGEVCVVAAVCRGVWWEAAALLVLQVKHSRFAGAAFAPRGVGALRVGRDEQFYNDWRRAVYVCFFPADDVAFVWEDAGFGDGEFRQVGIAQVGTAQVGTAQVGIAQVGTAQVGIAQVGIAQVGTAQVGTAQAVESVFFEDFFDVFAFESAVWRGDSHCGFLSVVWLITTILLYMCPATRREYKKNHQVCANCSTCSAVKVLDGL